MKRIRFLLLAVASLYLTACEKSGSNSDGDTKTASVVSNDSAKEITTKSGIQMVSIPAGQFMMGDDRGNADEAPAHKVTLSAFLIDKVEVTHEMFAKVQLPDPSHWQDNPSKPVERVRWRDAKRYCNERSFLEGLTPCYNEKTPDWDC